MEPKRGGFEELRDIARSRPITRREFTIRALAMGFAAASIPTLLAACGVAPDSSEAASDAPGAPSPSGAGGAVTTIKVLSWTWEESGRNTAWRNLVADFHAAQSEIRVEEAGFPYGQYEDALTTQLQAGGIDGDIITSTPALAVRLMKAEQFLPLDEAMTGIPELTGASDFLKQDGVLYGAPVILVPLGNIYNTDLFDAAGVSAADNLDDWVTISEQLTKRPDQFGIFSPNDAVDSATNFLLFSSWALAFDSAWATGSTPALTSDGILQTVDYFKKMYDVGMPQDLDYGSGLNLAYADRIAQITGPSALGTVIEANAPGALEHWRSQPCPWPSKKGLTNVIPLSVNVNSVNAEAAMEFINFAMQPAHLGKLMEDSLDFFPPYEPNPVSQEYLDAIEWADGFIQIDPVGTPALLGDFTAKANEFSDIVWSATAQVLSNSMSTADAMAAAQEQAEALAETL
jgi:ABC-type glycerol-3-phosphate transport system substrate-binding protein